MAKLCDEAISYATITITSAVQGPCSKPIRPQHCILLSGQTDRNRLGDRLTECNVTPCKTLPSRVVYTMQSVSETAYRDGSRIYVRGGGSKSGVKRGAVGVEINTQWASRKRGIEGGEIKTPKTSRGEVWKECPSPQPTKMSRGSVASGRKRVLMHYEHT